MPPKNRAESSGCFIYNLFIIIIVFNKRVWGRGGMGLIGEGRAKCCCTAAGSTRSFSWNLIGVDRRFF